MSKLPTSSSDGKGKAKSKSTSSQRKLLLSSTTDSVDLEEFEIDLTTDDDEVIAAVTSTSPKTPLIKDTSSPKKEDKGEKPKKGPTKTKPAKLTFNLNGSFKGETEDNKKKGQSTKKEEEDEDEDDEDEDDICETTRFSKSSSLNTPPPITIGKIKIFNPRRRRRILRFQRLLKRFLTFMGILVIILFLLHNIDSLPVLVATLFKWAGWSAEDSGPLNTGGKDANSRCNRIVSKPVWKTSFPRLTVESALRMVDVNNDTILDVIVPFGSGIDAAYYDPTLCQIYFNQTEVESKTIGCGGGVMAVNGLNGVLLWSIATAHELFASNCNLDINSDGIKDCVFGGRMASLYAVNGQTGAVFWSISSTFGDPISETSNFYTPLLIPKDVDGDGLSDLVVMHGGDPLRAPGARVRNVAKLMVISAKAGAILSWSFVPDGAESYYSPQLLVHPDGTALVLFGTGGETHPGGLYVVALDALLSGSIKHSCRTLLIDSSKGFISPPVLVDLNADGVLDIVMSTFNASVFALDGFTFELLWKRPFPGGETYSSPAVGYFNADNVPDFAVTYQFGPGFPIYYWAEFHVLDGRNGEELLKSPVRMPIGTQSSPLTVSTFAANDVFLFWYSGCANESLNQGSGNQSSDLMDNGPYQISPGATVHDSSRADFCRLRFGDDARQYTQYRAITLDSTATIYDSRRDEPSVELVNASQLAYQWYADSMAAGASDQGDNIVDGGGGVWGGGQVDNGLPFERGGQGRDDKIVYRGGDAFEQLRKYKKIWPQHPGGQSPDDGSQFSSDINNLLYRDDNQQPQNAKRKRRRQEKKVEGGHRWKRHVGLHNGDSVQRVISTGTLAPSLEKEGSSTEQELSVDGSIDVLFATYSFPPAANVKLMSAAMRRCIAEYLAPEKEAQLRLLDDSSLFKRLGYDHDAYEAAVKELCAKETGEEGDQSQQQSSKVEVDPVKANEWIRPMGSMTVHRVNLKCYDNSQKVTGKGKQIAIKEYFHQWWPGYLGLLADAIANMLDQ